MTPGTVFVLMFLSMLVGVFLGGMAVVVFGDDDEGHRRRIDRAFQEYRKSKEWRDFCRSIDAMQEIINRSTQDYTP